MKHLTLKYTLSKYLLDSLKIKNTVIYFEVEDNDAINGYKKSVSKIFQYINYSKEELEEKISKKQNTLIKNVEKLVYSNEKEKSLNKVMKKMSEDEKLNWVEKKK